MTGKKLTLKQILTRTIGVLKYIKPYKKDVLILSWISVFSAVLNATTPYISGKLIDSIINQGSSFSIIEYTISGAFLLVVVWLVAKIINDFVDWKLWLQSDWLSWRVEADYFAMGLSHLLELPIAFHKKNKMGEMSDRIIRAAGWLETIIGRTVLGLAPQFLSVVISLLFIFSINTTMSLAIVLALVFYVFALFRVTPGLAEWQRKGQKEYNRAFGYAYDLVANTHEVKQATAEERERRQLISKFRGKALNYFFHYFRLLQKTNLLQRVVVSVAQFFIFAFSIHNIWQGRMTIGELVMFNAYAALFFGPFTILAQNWMSLQTGLVAIERAEKILNEPIEAYNPEDGIDIKDMKGKVVLEDVDFKYEKGNSILENISFSVNPGEVAAIVGESGVGKTTLVDLLSYYIKPSEGSIYIDDIKIDKINLKSLRSRIAMVPQEVVLFNDTVINNIRYGKFGASDEDVIEAAKKAYANDFIMKFPKKYKQIVGERGIKLSTGQKQRVAMARAVLRDPRILILDEPTSALDAKSECEVVRALETLMKGRTTFIIAHRLSTVRKADKIIVLDKGKVVEIGKHDDLIKNKKGVYRKFYEVQKL